MITRRWTVDVDLECELVPDERSQGGAVYRAWSAARRTPWSYCLSVFLVAVAFAYCSQWRLLALAPHGVLSTFVIAVAFTVWVAGQGPGWVAAISSAVIIGTYYHSEVLCFEPDGDGAERCLWFVVTLLAPLIAGGGVFPVTFRRSREVESETQQNQPL